MTEWLLPVLDFELTTSLLGLSFLAIGSIAAWAAPREVRWSVLFAGAVIISMFWSYRRGYDCALLVIPMVLLFDVAARRGGTALWATALVFGVSLWLPVRNEQWKWDVVQVLHAAVWGVGGVALIASELAGRPHKVSQGLEEPRIQALA